LLFLSGALWCAL